jgi:hypothetical protein
MPAYQFGAARHGVAVERQALELPSSPNQVWSMDFVSDALANGRRIKVLTIDDDCPRRSRIEPPCRPRIDPGMGADRMRVGCG